MRHLGLHMVQSIPANNINRGNDGEVKTVSIGGTVRQRVSAAAWGRPNRQQCNEFSKSEDTNFGIFSRVFGSEIEARLKKDGIVIDDLANILNAIGLGGVDIEKPKPDSDGSVDAESEVEESKDVMMYLSNQELDIIYECIKSGNIYELDKDGKPKVKKSKKGKPKVVAKQLSAMLEDAHCRNPYDIATFGRMFANDQIGRAHV